MQNLKGASFSLPFLLGFALFTITPLFVAIGKSVYSSQASGLGLGNQEITFTGVDNFVRGLQDVTFWSGLLRVFLYALVVVPLIQFVGLVMALLLDGVRRRSANRFRVALLLPYMVPGMVGTMIWLYQYSPTVGPIAQFLDTFGISVDFYDAVWFSIGNMAVWGGIGFTMLILYGSLQSVPAEIFDAARVDGASEVRDRTQHQGAVRARHDRADQPADDHRHAPAVQRTHPVPDRLAGVDHEGLHPGDDDLQPGLPGGQRQLCDGALDHPRGRDRRGLRGHLPAHEQGGGLMSSTVTAGPAKATVTTEASSAVGPGRRTRTRETEPGVVTDSSRWVVLAGLIAFAAYSVVPVWWLVVAATKSKEDLFRTNGMWFADLNLFENLRALFSYQDAIYGEWLWNTFLYAAGSGVGHTLVALAAGYGIAKYQYRGRGATMAVIIASFLIPGTLMTIPSYVLYVNLGIYDTIWAMIIPACFSSFAVYLAKVYAEGAVPGELIEAARIDGAGEYRIFFGMGLRLMTTAGATIFLLHFVGTWNAFMGPLVFLRDVHKWPVMLGLYSWLQRGVDSQYDLTSLVITGALVATVPMVVMMVAMQRYWRSGVTLGSLK